MATNRNTNKSIPVWVNAGDKAIVFNRIDGQAWDHPLFVSAPNGVREELVKTLAKDADGKATRNITWDLPVSMVEKSFIQKGDNAGKPMMSVKITEEFLADWLSQLNVTRRGAVKPEVKTTLDNWAASIIPADDHVDLDTLESF